MSRPPDRDVEANDVWLLRQLVEDAFADESPSSESWQRIQARRAASHAGPAGSSLSRWPADARYDAARSWRRLAGQVAIAAVLAFIRGIILQHQTLWGPSTPQPETVAERRPSVDEGTGDVLLEAIGQMPAPAAEIAIAPTETSVDSAPAAPAAPADPPALSMRYLTKLERRAEAAARVPPMRRPKAVAPPPGLSLGYLAQLRGSLASKGPDIFSLSSLQRAEGF